MRGFIQFNAIKNGIKAMQVLTYLE